MSRKMRFSKLEMKFVEFSFLVSEYKIISGGIRKVIYWSFNWYMYKFINYFSGKLLVLLTFFLAPLAEGQRAIVMAWGRRASVRPFVRACVRKLFL